jgi:hypothetical protein
MAPEPLDLAAALTLARRTDAPLDWLFGGDLHGMSLRRILDLGEPEISQARAALDAAGTDA